MSNILVMVGVAMTLFGGFWLLSIIFQEGCLWALGSFFVPIIGLIFVFTHWEDTKKPFLVQVAGAGIFLLGVWLGK
jgi:hypothetical protein